MKKNSKKIRKEKHEAFLADKFPKIKKSKICKITKGEHIYNVPSKISWGGGYEAICECGKTQWKLPRLKALKNLPDFMICKKHGYYEISSNWRGEKENIGCWACKADLDKFKDNI